MYINLLNATQLDGVAFDLFHFGNRRLFVVHVLLQNLQEMMTDRAVRNHARTITYLFSRRPIYFGLNPGLFDEL